MRLSSWWNEACLLFIHLASWLSQEPHIFQLPLHSDLETTWAVVRIQGTRKEPSLESQEPRLQKADTGLSSLCSYDRTQDSTHTVTQHSCRETGMWKDLDHLLSKNCPELWELCVCPQDMHVPVRRTMIGLGNTVLNNYIFFSFSSLHFTHLILIW